MSKETTDESTLFEQSKIEQAKSVMKPFVLRRLKADVLKYLPTKNEVVVSFIFSINKLNNVHMYYILIVNTY